MQGNYSGLMADYLHRRLLIFGCLVPVCTVYTCLVRMLLFYSVCEVDATSRMHHIFAARTLLVQESIDCIHDSKQGLLESLGPWPKILWHGAGVHHPALSWLPCATVTGSIIVSSQIDGPRPESLRPANGYSPEFSFCSNAFEHCCNHHHFLNSHLLQAANR